MAIAFHPGFSAGSLFENAYEIVSALGSGTFGSVYRARQRSTGQDVAIKVLRVHPEDGDEDAGRVAQRFRREMRLCADLYHPNIVRLIDSGESEAGLLYSVFEYVPGVTLREVLEAEHQLCLREAVHLMAQVLDALSCAHARGIVHRDLKPDNIMIANTSARRNALVLDFGLGGLARELEGRELTRITTTREMLGTPCYAAPEQLRGEPPAPSSDLYSWALVFLECLTGEAAVGGASVHEVILNQLGPEPVAIPSWLRRHRLGRALEIAARKAIEKRDVTAECLLDALSALDALELRDPETARSLPMPARERRQLTVVAGRLTLVPLDSRAPDLEAVDELLHAGHRLCEALATSAGGQVASLLADRVLLVFGHPRSREDDTQRAAHTALRIAAEVERQNGRLAAERQLRLEVRFAVHAGLVIVHESSDGSPGDVVGSTPEVAGRLVERAAPGEVLATAEAHRLLGADIAAEPAGRLRLQEQSGPVDVFRLTQDLGRARHGEVSLARETPLVGRANELGRLFAAWQQAKSGHASTVLITGEPGMGKSRLVRELRRRVPPDAWLEARCGAEFQNSPLRPIVDMLAGLPGGIEAVLRHYGFDLAENLPLFTSLLSTPLPEGYAPLPLTPPRQKELTLAAVLSLLLRMAQERPLVLAVEDLHWADPTTLELAAQLVAEVQSARRVVAEKPPHLCVVFTTRPTLTPPWSQDDTMLIQLPPLGSQDVEEMIIAGLAMGRSLPRALVEEVALRADGVPLFVEEVTRVLIQSGDVGLGAEADGPAIPSTLRALLSARVDMLSDSARDAVRLAAVLGREFRYDVLHAVMGRQESFVRADVRELVDSGLVYPRRGARGERYVFKHSLIREAAYESMTRPTRQSLHSRVASTLRHGFADVEEYQPELLALHLEQAGDEHAAAEYWQRAGERALVRAAYTEALRQLERGLGLLARLPESPARHRREIALLATLGTVEFSTKGYGVPEVERIFSRARLLSEQLGEDTPVGVLYGIMGVHLTRDDREGTAALLPRFQRLAERRDDPVSSIIGHAVVGTHAFLSGDLVVARNHLAVGKTLHSAPAVQRFARDHGYDIGLYCHAYEMTSLWQLGYPEQAEASRRVMFSLAEESRNPYSLAMALGFTTTLLHNRGDTDGTLAAAERLIALATEQRLHFWLGIGLCARGGASLGRGRAAEAVADVSSGLDIFVAAGIRTSYSYYQTYLAAAHRDEGNVEKALAVVQHGLSLCEMHYARHHESELWRMKGELLHGQGDVEGAEAALERAVHLARRQAVKAFELRAATSLARLHAAHGSRDTARRALADVYGWFVEGLDTRDLRVARALLTELETNQA